MPYKPHPSGCGGGNRPRQDAGMLVSQKLVRIRTQPDDSESHYQLDPAPSSEHDADGRTVPASSQISHQMSKVGQRLGAKYGKADHHQHEHHNLTYAQPQE